MRAVQLAPRAANAWRIATTSAAALTDDRILGRLPAVTDAT
jgi:hypothetical protein